MASDSATKLPVMAAVRVPPSACKTSQSSQRVRGPIFCKSTAARMARPIRRWISWERPSIFPLKCPAACGSEWSKGAWNIPRSSSRRDALLLHPPRHRLLDGHAANARGYCPIRSESNRRHTGQCRFESGWGAIDPAAAHPTEVLKKLRSKYLRPKPDLIRHPRPIQHSSKPSPGNVSNCRAECPR